MKGKIFVNLKRFEVARELGGVCSMSNPVAWIEWVIGECVQNKLGLFEELEVILLLPEALIPSAVKKLQEFPVAQTKAILIGSQSVFRENIAVGGNFGAFTSNLPATAAKNLGCTWSIIGHSEERKDKLGIIEKYQPLVATNESERGMAKKAVDALINQAVIAALKSGLNVIMCIGETAEERGLGEFEEQKPRIEATLRTQLEIGLKDVAGFLPEQQIVIGYEPIWAIGPGKTPPGAEYISFVSAYIKQVVQELYGFEPMVVYGGGLKEENAGFISKIATIDGGLVALTRFSGEIGFYPDELSKIIDKYLE